jgi:D-sedoheptulose 7-phosphate isomerase
MTQPFFKDYATRLATILASADWSGVERLGADLLDGWRERRQVFICGNGGSAGNAIHLANDFIYGVAMPDGNGIRAHALPANPAVLTCLANDIGYERIFAAQIAVHAMPGDLLIAFSGSGNSPNIVAALEEARKRSVKSYAVLGYSGGKAKALADVAIHFPVDDMQIAEDLQIVVGHMLMQWLHAHRIQPQE